MKIEKAVEKITLTQQEANALAAAYEIAMDIRDNAETIASDYAVAVMDAISDLINAPEGQESYTIGVEKMVNKKSVFVTVEL